MKGKEDRADFERNRFDAHAVDIDCRVIFVKMPKIHRLIMLNKSKEVIKQRFAQRKCSLVAGRNYSRRNSRKAKLKETTEYESESPARRKSAIFAVLLTPRKCFRHVVAWG